MTNGDKIRSMSDAELKQFLIDIYNHNIEVGKGYCTSECPDRAACNQFGSCVNNADYPDYDWWLTQSTL